MSLEILNILAYDSICFFHDHVTLIDTCRHDDGMVAARAGTMYIRI